ncbi:MAG: phasin family protein [Proteobacteria bacterium]|nr:phasin family protein [Pseudomonadota bacterium]
MTNKRNKKPAAPAANTAHDVWLAGLGAVSIAQKRGTRLLAGLAAEGRDFQSRAQQLVREVRADAQSQLKGALAPLRMHARDNARKAGVLIQRIVAQALDKLGVPTKSDIESLSQRMSALSRQLKAVK